MIGVAAPVGTRFPVPAEAYVETLSVRSYEARRDGRVHPGTLLRYLEHLATRASASLGFDHLWYERHGSAWVVREMRLWLASGVSLDDELALATWLSEIRRVQANREYAIWNAATGGLVARAQARWAFVDREHGQLKRIPDPLLERFVVPGSALPAAVWRHIGATATGAPVAEMQIIARDYEADTQQHVNNCVYADWLEEAVFDATAGAEPRRDTSRQLRARVLHVEYLRPVYPGEVVTLRTRIASTRTRELQVAQEIVTGTPDALAVRASSRYLRVLPAS